jgi:hypothetical protein
MGVFIGFISFVLFMGIVAGMIMLNGLVFKIMWCWFLVPLGLPPIGIAMAVGIGSIVTLMTRTPVRKIEKGKGFTYVVESTTQHLIKLGLILVVGWIAHQYL